VYEIIGKEYRSSNVSRIELRFNPMKRNVGGTKDLDHIIHAAVRGLNQASLEYGVEAGLILCLAREFPPEQNEKILEKAIKYAPFGVVGIDVAGTETQTLELNDQVSIYAEFFARARAAGLGTTIHTGETKATSGEGVIAVLKHLRPHRIGHGIRAAYSDEAIARLSDTGTVLEICPTSNLHTRAVSSIEDFRYIIARFRDGNVPFTINTDGTYLCRTNLQREFSILEDAGILQKEEIPIIRERAFEASFIS
jgi:adenosine deaminase